MPTTITWKKLANGDIEQTTVVSIVKVKVIPAAGFDKIKADIATAHQSRVDRITRDNKHMDVMQGAIDAKEGETVSIEYDDQGTSVINADVT